VAPLVRRLLFWCHLVAGLVAGSIVLIMSVTGVLLTYEKQMASWADRRGFAITPVGTRVAPDAMIGAARAAAGGGPATTLTMWADPAAPVAIAVAQKTLYLDPYTGQVLGESRAQPRAFFRKMTDWHRWLGASPEGRAQGRMITGACNLAFLFLVLSGLYLWLPKIWTWRQVRNVAWFKGGLSGKARDFNWHNAIGVWCCIPLASGAFHCLIGMSRGLPKRHGKCESATIMLFHTSTTNIVLISHHSYIGRKLRVIIFLVRTTSRRDFHLR